MELSTTLVQKKTKARILRSIFIFIFGGLSFWILISLILVSLFSGLMLIMFNQNANLLAVFKIVLSPILISIAMVLRIMDFHNSGLIRSICILITIMISYVTTYWIFYTLKEDKISQVTFLEKVVQGFIFVISGILLSCTIFLFSNTFLEYGMDYMLTDFISRLVNLVLWVFTSIEGFIMVTLVWSLFFMIYYYTGIYVYNLFK